MPGLLPGESLPPLLMLRVPSVPVPDKVPATLVVPLRVPATFRKPPLLMVEPPLMVPPEMELPAPFTVKPPVASVPELLRVLLPARETAPIEPVPLKVAPLAIVLLPVAAPLTCKAELAVWVMLPETVPLEIKLPVPLTVMPLVVSVPPLLKVLFPARVTVPTVPVPVRVARLASESLPAVPFTVRAELAFWVIAPETVPPLIELPTPLTVTPLVVSTPLPLVPERIPFPVRVTAPIVSVRVLKSKVPVPTLNAARIGQDVVCSESERASAYGRAAGVGIRARKRPSASARLRQAASGGADDARNTAIASAGQCQAESGSRDCASVSQVKRAAVGRNCGRRGESEQAAVVFVPPTLTSAPFCPAAPVPRIFNASAPTVIPVSS